MTHFKSIGLETGNEAVFEGKKCVFIENFEDFSKTDGNEGRGTVSQVVQINADFFSHRWAQMKHRFFSTAKDTEGMNGTKLRW
jgi:hypothetical protein